MRRVGQHFEGLNSIRFQRAMENEESGKCEVTFDFLSVELVDLQMCSDRDSKRAKREWYLVDRHRIHLLRTEGKYTATPSRIPLERLVIPFRYVCKHTLDRLRSTFDGHKSLSGRKGRHGGHALEGRRELETTADVNS